ncbi:carbon-nitrogen hydrolase family protein [Streptomyces sp. SBC-4]|nr:carbon-nitrogen hydrolase family protein [Streptomyces sp. SBC-4]MDV5142824.1 carbon-nitrogen hydrolase family protein [Streptomyces sp. SBC-4]
MRTLAIAALQTTPVPHDLEASWQRFAEQVRATREMFPHVQLVVVPELLLAAEGALLQPAADDWMEQTAVTIPGPLTDRICALAVETGLWLIPGSLYERAEEGHVHNTAIAVSPQGEIVARYRKVFPWQPYEKTTPGHEFTVFDIPGAGRVGLAICYDGSFPETARQLAWLGAEIIIQPTLTPTRDREMELVCARANAWTNQVYVVNVNASDPAGSAPAPSSTPKALSVSRLEGARRSSSTSSTSTPSPGSAATAPPESTAPGASSPATGSRYGSRCTTAERSAHRTGWRTSPRSNRDPGPLRAGTARGGRAGVLRRGRPLRGRSPWQPCLGGRDVTRWWRRPVHPSQAAGGARVFIRLVSVHQVLDTPRAPGTVRVPRACRCAAGGGRQGVGRVRVAFCLSSSVNTIV